MNTHDNIEIIKKEVSSITVGITHPGVFHADDVFTAAFLKLLNNEICIERRIPNKEDIEDNTKIVFDVGGGKYDHHNMEKEFRKNGVPYSSFGLVVRHFWPIVFEDEMAYQLFDSQLVQPIDATDNSGIQNPLSSLIHSMNPSWDEPSDFDHKFDETVKLVKPMLEAKISSIKSSSRARGIIKAAGIVDGTIWMDRYVPVNQEDTKASFIGSPSLRGGYQLLSIRHVDGQVLFPEKYRGTTSLARKVGMTFCHAGGFIAVFSDKTTAEKFMKENYPSEF